MSLIASSQLTIIIGLGLTGMSVARYLQKKNINFMVMDSRVNPPNSQEFSLAFPGVVAITGRLDEELLAAASEIIISPGVSLKTPELQMATNAGVPVVGDIELFARATKKPIIAITGSNAKSTVTQLVGEMAKNAGLRAAVGGNIGIPVLDLLDKFTDKNSHEEMADIYVLELSSFQLETTYSLCAEVATVLNVSMDHMDRYQSLAEYHKAKQRIYLHAKNLVINRQDALTHPPLSKNAKVSSFGSNVADINGFGLAQRNNKTYLMHQFTPLVPVDELAIKGKHNAVNALAALALGHAAGFSMSAMLLALKQFSGLPHRCEYVDTINNVDYINDSKATNVGATIAALEGFSADKHIVLIAGGDGKSADFSPLVKPIKQFVRGVVLIGCDAPKLEQFLVPVVACQRAGSLQEAVSMAQKLAHPDDIVLLSPACASFDMFKSFEDRGSQFVTAVKKLREMAA